MKKTIALFAALSVCALMVTACGSKRSGDDILIDNIPAAEITGNNDILSDHIPDEIPDGDDTEITEINDTDNDDQHSDTDHISETENEEETAAAESETEPFEVSAVYASIEEFAAADDIFSYPAEAVDVEDQYTYAFMEYLRYGNDLYIEAERFENIDDIPDSGQKLSIATAENKLAIFFSEDDYDTNLIMSNGRSYIVNDDMKAAAYIDLGEDGYEDSIKNMTDEFLSVIKTDDEAFYGWSLMSYKADIGGEIYTFEFSTFIGMLYDQEGKLCLKINKKTDAYFYAVRVNEFSEDVPDGIFDIPSDYELFDFFAEE